ncbi:hypothetical protein [Salipiger abyssi]|uniref:hypothetical protein n=1 Tax=Salipiger abyssi TaxID=1250539 RepID=UPI001A8C8927|nr:hypothetical protein [Salipiger abyssi]MBN9887200.1 hypothetical protein [Salipiger abyssi]
MKIAAVSPSSSDGLPPEEIARRKARRQSYASPGTVFEDFNISGNNVFAQKFSMDFITDVAERTHLITRAAAESNPDVIMVSGGIEPGAAASRQEIQSVPIVSTGQAAYNVAYQLGFHVGHKLGIMVYEEKIIDPIMAQATLHRADWMVTAIKQIDVPLPELNVKRELVRERMVEVAKELVAGGATMIFPQGLSMMPAAMDEYELSKACGVPVLNGEKILVRTAEMIGGLDLLRQGARSAAAF